MISSGFSSLPQEYTVNIALADLLDHLLQGVGRAVPENRTSSKNHRFDVKITYKDIVFVLEAAYDEPGAELDAKKRLEEGFIDTVSIAIHYEPAIFRHKDTLDEIKEALKSNLVKLKIFTQGNEVSANLTSFMQKKSWTAVNQGGWIYVNFNQIMQLMDSIIEFLVTEDTASELLRSIEYYMQDFSNTAIQELGSGPRKSRILADLRHILFSPEPESGELEVEISDEIVMFHTYVTIFLAMLLYESIFRNYEQLSGIDFYKENIALDPLKCLKEAFTKVNDEIDYESVFSVAIQVISALKDIPPGGQIASRLRDIKEQVQQIFANRALLRQDFIGRVYHRVTGDLPLRKGFATYYTKAEIASFLSELVINNYEHNLKNLVRANGPDIESRIGDLSCGSGTLLSAAYSSVLGKFRELNEEVGYAQLVDFHHIMIEHILWGIDALENAVQAASVVLALHEPGTPLDNFNMLRYPIRVSGELGSISLWDKKQVILKRRGKQGRTDEKVDVPSFDLIISNPPFSRNTAPGSKEGLRPRIFGFVTNDAAYNSLLNNYKVILGEMERYLDSSEAIRNLIVENVGKDKPFKSGDINPLNSGAFFPFIVMYERYLKSDGILALVLPLSVLEAASNLYLRALMIAHFSVDFIIVSGDVKNQNFSYSTNLSECLIVLRKTNSTQKNDCAVVRFTVQPKNTLEGILMAKKLIRDINTGNIALNGTIEFKRIKYNSLEKMLWNWGPLIKYPQHLLSILDDLLDSIILGTRVPMVKLGTFLKENKRSIGNPRAYRGKFLSVHMKANTIGPFKFLYEAGSNVMDRMHLRPDYKIKQYNFSEDKDPTISICTGHIIVPESFRLNTMPLIAAFSPSEIFSGVAYSITTGNLNLDKAIVTWMNSIFGILILRTFFSTVQGNFGHIRGWHLRSWLIPDFSHSEFGGKLVSIFEKYSSADFPKMTDQLKYAIINEKSDRRRFDKDIIKSFCPNLSEAEVDGKLNIMYSALLGSISR